MKKNTLLLSALCTALLTSAAFADSNGVLGGVINSETQVLTGSFDHGAATGDADNSTATATFSGNFTVTQVLIEGDLTGVLTFPQGGALVYFYNEAAIAVTSPDGDTNVTPGPGGEGEIAGWTSLLDGDTAPGPFSYSAIGTAPTPNSTAAGTWGFEFFDIFDDGDGADTISNNVSVTLQEATPNVDPIGSFGLTFDANGEATSVGELLSGVPGIWDEYPINVTQAGQVEITTFPDDNGIAGRDLDSVIGVFDSSGILIAQNDDRNEDFFSRVFINLDVGTYTIVVTGISTNIDTEADPADNTSVGILNLADLVGNGPEPEATGDYSLSVSGAPGAIEGISPALKGDVDMSGVVDFGDIGPFIGLLQTGTFQAEGDCDCSTVVDFGDIAPFITILQTQ